MRFRVELAASLLHDGLVEPGGDKGIFRDGTIGTAFRHDPGCVVFFDSGGLPGMSNMCVVFKLNEHGTFCASVPYYFTSID